MDQRYIDLYDEFTHTGMARRVFMERLVKLAGSTAAATSIASMIGPNYAKAAIVPENDSRLTAGMVTYPGKTGPVKAYHVRQKGDAKLPAIVVIHENRGLNPHIQDIGRRLALEGYNVIVPDSLSPMGGTPASTDDAVQMIAKLDNANTLANYVAAVSYIKKDSTGKVGCVGFCWGGGFSNQTALASPDINAAVVYYGLAPKPDEVSKVHAPTIVHLGALDQRIDDTYPPFEAALKQSGKDKLYTIYTYAGANHAFNNDSDPTRYHEASAKQAWERTLNLFKTNLKA